VDLKVKNEGEYVLKLLNGKDLKIDKNVLTISELK
jgi:hypothetical protein